MPTGLAGQATQFAQTMRDAGHEIFYVGLGQSVTRKVDGITLLTTGDTKFGETILQYWIDKYKPDVLWTLLDVWMTNYIALGGTQIDGDAYPIKLGNTKWVGYIPIDSNDLVPPEYEKFIQAYDFPVLMSQFALNLMGKRFIDTAFSYIPHSIDTNIFRPLPESEIKAFKKANKVEGCFLIGMNGNNQLRKMQPYLLEAYAKFMKPDTRLVLHMDMKNSRGLWNAEGWNLIKVASLLKIPPNHIIITDAGKGFSGKFDVTPDKINLFYNACDVHYNCGNEGFGIPMLESLSAGTPNISPDFTTAKEMIGNNERGRLVKLGQFWYHQHSGHRWCTPDTDDLAAQFQWCYDNRDKLKEMGTEARKFALDYDHKNVQPLWTDFIKSVLMLPPLPTNYKTGEVGI